MKAHTLFPDGRVVDSEISDGPFPVALMRGIVEGNVEYVAVIFEGHPATLIVNEVGAVTDLEINPAAQLTPNPRATAIYWTATIQGRTGSNYAPLTMPMVYGVAVLIERDKRML
jgi:hypothetical protein